LNKKKPSKCTFNENKMASASQEDAQHLKRHTYQQLKNNTTSALPVNIVETPFKNVEAAAITTLTIKTLMSPFERAAYFVTAAHEQQAQHTHTRRHNSFYRNLSLLTRAVKREGLTTLWRGNVQNLIHFVPFATAYPVTKDLFRANVFAPYFSNMYCINFASGAASSVVSLVSHPFHVAWTLEQQRQPVPNTLTFGTLKTLYKHYLTVVLPGVVLLRSISFGLMDTLVPNSNLVPLWQQILFGQFASLCASVASHPFERAKLLMQHQQQHAVHEANRASRVMLQMIRQGTLMQGVTAHIVRNSSIGLLMTTYGQLKNYFNKKQQQEESKL